MQQEAVTQVNSRSRSSVLETRNVIYIYLYIHIYMCVYNKGAATMMTVRDVQRVDLPTSQILNNDNE
jgi:hypothetical protein